jgi:hypothetical protein
LGAGGPRFESEHPDSSLHPLGRFFDNTTGRHTYSDPILDVGIEAAWAQVQLFEDRFQGRAVRLSDQAAQGWLEASSMLATTLSKQA